MKAIKFRNVTTEYGAPEDWNDLKTGHCDPLPVREFNINGVPAMESFWEPSADEIEQIKNGANISLVVIGTAHPPVSLRIAGSDECASEALSRIIREFIDVCDAGHLPSKQMLSDAQDELNYFKPTALTTK
jgi:hypothetical protein